MCDADAACTSLTITRTGRLPPCTQREQCDPKYTIGDVLFPLSDADGKEKMAWRAPPVTDEAYWKRVHQEMIHAARVKEFVNEFIEVDAHTKEPSAPHKGAGGVDTDENAVEVADGDANEGAAAAATGMEGAAATAPEDDNMPAAPIASPKKVIRTRHPVCWRLPTVFQQAPEHPPPVSHDVPLESPLADSLGTCLGTIQKTLEKSTPADKPVTEGAKAKPAESHRKPRYVPFDVKEGDTAESGAEIKQDIVTDIEHALVAVAQVKQKTRKRKQKTNGNTIDEGVEQSAVQEKQDLASDAPPIEKSVKYANPFLEDVIGYTTQLGAKIRDAITTTNTRTPAAPAEMTTDGDAGEKATGSGATSATSLHFETKEHAQKMVHKARALLAVCEASAGCQYPELLDNKSPGKRSRNTRPKDEDDIASERPAKITRSQTAVGESARTKPNTRSSKKRIIDSDDDISEGSGNDSD